MFNLKTVISDCCSRNWNQRHVKFGKSKAPTKAPVDYSLSVIRISLNCSISRLDNYWSSLKSAVRPRHVSKQKQTASETAELAVKFTLQTPNLVFMLFEDSTRRKADVQLMARQVFVSSEIWSFFSSCNGIWLQTNINGPFFPSLFFLFSSPLITCSSSALC